MRWITGTLLACVGLKFACAIDIIGIRGNKFYNTVTGQRFFVNGIAYQPTVNDQFEGKKLIIFVWFEGKMLSQTKTAKDGRKIWPSCKNLDLTSYASTRYSFNFIIIII